MTSLSRWICLLVLPFALMGCVARARGPAYVEAGYYSRPYVETYPGYYRRSPPRAYYYAPPPRAVHRHYEAPRAYRHYEAPRARRHYEAPRAHRHHRD